MNNPPSNTPQLNNPSIIMNQDKICEVGSSKLLTEASRRFYELPIDVSCNNFLSLYNVNYTIIYIYIMCQYTHQHIINI